MKLTAEEEKIARGIAKPRNGHNTLQDAQALFYLQQAAVRHEALTNQPEWDFFLSQLQAWADKTREQIEYWKSLIADADFDESRVAQARKYLLLCQERAQTLAAVMNLPKEVIRAGENAKLELEAIGTEAMGATKN